MKAMSILKKVGYALLCVGNAVASYFLGYYFIDVMFKD